MHILRLNRVLRTVSLRKLVMNIWMRTHCNTVQTENCNSAYCFHSEYFHSQRSDECSKRQIGVDARHRAISIVVFDINNMKLRTTESNVCFNRASTSTFILHSFTHVDLNFYFSGVSSMVWWSSVVSLNKPHGDVSKRETFKFGTHSLLSNISWLSEVLAIGRQANEISRSIFLHNAFKVTLIISLKV